MNPEEQIPVKVSVANRNIQLRVPRKNEEFVRLAARMVNKRMEDFKQYEVGEPEDRLAWAALDYTTDLVQLHRHKEDNNQDVYRTLGELENLLNIS